MSDITRRQALSHLAAAFAATAAIDYVFAQEAHAFVQQTAARGPYTPTALSPQQFRTLERLTDLIIPVENGKPGAVQASVPAWIDSLLNVNIELKAKYVAGLAWLDTASKAAGATDFATATPAQQTALLDQIAFKKNASAALDPGIEFFVLARRMTVDGFYTSELGVRDILPQGRPPMPKFIVPQESVDYVISRSPFK
ncbi:MAG: gluconate 2-dehydrogenase subunit 3 family protein [Vicinamibacterales bacterium]